MRINGGYFLYSRGSYSNVSMTDPDEERPLRYLRCIGVEEDISECKIDTYSMACVNSYKYDIYIQCYGNTIDYETMGRE